MVPVSFGGIGFARVFGKNILKKQGALI